MNDKPTLTGARTVFVKPLADESRLRNLAWIESNRKRVDAGDARPRRLRLRAEHRRRRADGALAAVSRADRQGRHDHRRAVQQRRPDSRPLRRAAGSPDRRTTGRRATASTQQSPPVANPGPKAMLINGWSGSGGDAFPYYFKQARPRPADRPRTWGGLIGISGTPPFVDGGNVTAPTFADLRNRRQMDRRGPRRRTRHRRGRRSGAARQGRRSAARARDQGSHDRGRETAEASGAAGVHEADRAVVHGRKAAISIRGE